MRPGRVALGVARILLFLAALALFAGTLVAVGARVLAREILSRLTRS